MTQPYIGPDPVEATGDGKFYSSYASQDTSGHQSVTDSTIDNFLFQQEMTPELEQQLPTYNPMSIADATSRFRGYFTKYMALYSGVNTIDDLGNKVLDMTRPKLSPIVNAYPGLKDYIENMGEHNPDGKEALRRDIAADIPDPISRRVFREYLRMNEERQGYYDTGDYSAERRPIADLEGATKRFQDIYMNSMFEEMGTKTAAAILDVTERTVRNRVKSYQADQRNEWKFCDDCKDNDLEERALAAKRIETATERAARQDEQEWQVRQRFEPAF